MTAITHKPEQPWFNPSMLEWARRWRGLSLEDVAKKFKKTPDQIHAWERSETSPTVKQARKLAALYDRSFNEFFLPSPPKITKPGYLPDFRLHKDILDSSQEWEVQQLQQWAKAQRESALDLLQELGEKPTAIDPDLFASTNSSPERKAELARRVVKFSKSDQLDLKKSQAYTLPNILRSKLEAIGILTLRKSELKKYGIRGMCISEFPLPAIVLTSESPTAQAFTIAHEFAHVVLNSSGVSGPRTKDYNNVPEEKWCDRFAAAFLMPKSLIEQTLGRKPESPASEISDEELKESSNLFRVSPHAMLIRLVHLEYVESRYYWGFMKPIFDNLERSEKSFGRSTYYGARYRSQLGDLYTGLVMESWSTGRITNHNAAEYMGIKNLKHLNDIRNEFYSK